MNEAPHPSVSTGTGEDEYRIPEGMSKDTFYVRFVWNGKTREIFMGPDFIPSIRDRIEGWRRAASAAYLVMRDGNRCTIASPEHCLMKGKPFANPEGADFDQIVLFPPDHRISNRRLACHPCNSHKQKEQLAELKAQLLQWKSTHAASSTREREREFPAGAHSEAPAATSAETDRSLYMFPRTVRLLFAPGGYLAEPGDHIGKDWLINNLPEKVGKGRSVTYSRYVHEWVMQGYLTEENFDTGDRGSEVHLVKTQKPTDKLLERELGIKPKAGSQLEEVREK